MRFLVDFCQFIAALFIAPVMVYRSWRTGKYRTDWDQRQGHMPDLPPATAQRPRVWVHAVSVGEMNAVRGLIDAWRERSPETQIVISCTTDTGIARARELFPALTIIRYPLDFSRFVKRAFDRIKPSLIVLVELEVWFNFVTIARRRGIPVAIVNGRLSEKSAKWFARVPFIARRMFGALAWVGAQDEQYAERFRRVGVRDDHVSVTGSLKWETALITDSIPGALELARAMGIQTEPVAQAMVSSGDATNPIDHPAPSELNSDRGPEHHPIWVCGSTGPGEEEIILNVFKMIHQHDAELRRLQLVIVPRKPDRFDEVSSLIERAGFVCIRRSESPDGTSRPHNVKAVLLIDTMGELRKVYSLADVVFVGRSLVPMGGSDMMEVAGLAKPIIVGPHTENFRDAMQQLCEAEAVWSIKRDYVLHLSVAVSHLLGNEFERRTQGANARAVVVKNQGATQRTLDRLLSFVCPAPAA